MKPGHYHVELGQDVIHVDRHRRYLAGTYNLNVGVSNRIEVDLGVTVAYDAKERGESDGGLGDVQILGKVRLLDERSRAPALALVGSVTFPSRDVKGDLSVGETCYRAIVAATKSLGPIGLSSNAGWSFLPGASDELLLSVALDYPLSPRWQILAEWDMARAMRSGAHETVSGLFTGLSWSPSERVSWDGGVRWGTTDADAGHRITFGLALGF